MLGGYLLLFPYSRVNTLVFFGFFIHVAQLPAYLLLGFWAVLQVFSGLGSLGPSSGGVAYFAHLGGFAMGLAVVAALRILQRQPVWPRRRRSYYWRGGSYELDE